MGVEGCRAALQSRHHRRCEAVHDLLPISVAGLDESSGGEVGRQRVSIQAEPGQNGARKATDARVGYLASEKDASAARSGVSAAMVAARAASCREERIMKYLTSAPGVESA